MPIFYIYYKLYLWLIGMAYTNMGNTCTTLCVHGFLKLWPCIVTALYGYESLQLRPI